MGHYLTLSTHAATIARIVVKISNFEKYLCLTLEYIYNFQMWADDVAV